MTIHNITHTQSLLDQSAECRRIRRMLSWGRIKSAKFISDEILRRNTGHVVHTATQY